LLHISIFHLGYHTYPGKFVTLEYLSNIFVTHCCVRFPSPDLARTFRTEPINLSAYLGDVVLLPCSIDGAPTPVVTWMKDDRDLEPLGSANLLLHAESGILEIRSVQFSDFGRYRCRASNGERSKMSAEAVLTQNGDVCK